MITTLLRSHDVATDLYYATATLNVFLAFVLYFLGRVFDDDMLERMSFGFVCIALARVIHGVFLLGHPALLFLVLLLRGLAGGFLIWGAFNGTRRYFETPAIFTGAVVVSSFIGAFYTKSPTSQIMPIAFAICFGYAVCAYVFWQKAKGPVCRRTGLPAYRYLAALFFLKIFLGAASSFDWHGVADNVIFSGLEAAIVLGLMWAFIELGVERLKITPYYGLK